MFVRNAWYAIAMGKELESEQLFSRVVLKEKIVLFRKLNGVVTALQDRCAHRQLPLSMGRLINETVQCGYHGLQYDAEGKCIEIPSQLNIPDKVCVKNYPCVEKYGVIWVWMGERNKADNNLIPEHQICDTPELAGEMFHTLIKCEYRYGIDNILDISHAAFVHIKTLGSSDVVESVPEVEISENEILVTRQMSREKSPPLYQKIMQSEYIDRTQTVKYYPIGNLLVTTKATFPDQPKGKAFSVYTTSIITPETETSSHIFVAMHRDFLIDNEQLTTMITQQVVSTVEEDKLVTEAMQANLDPDAFMINIKLDKAGNAARRMLDRLYSEENQQPVNQERSTTTAEIA